MTSTELRILEQIPVDVFKDKELFRGVLKECWSNLPQIKKDDFKHRFLPSHGTFPVSCQDETIDLLLDGQLGMFDVDPIDRIYFDMKISKLAPDIKQTLKKVKTLQIKAQQLREKEFQMKIWSEISMHRKCLFKSSLNVACDEQIKSSEPVQDWSSSCSLFLSKAEAKSIRRNVRKRYLDELRKLTTETELNFLGSSDDEDVRDEILDMRLQRSEVNLHNRRVLKIMKMYKKKRKCDFSLDGTSSAITIGAIIDRVEGRQIDEVLLQPPAIPAAMKPKACRKTKPSPATSKVAQTNSTIPLHLKPTPSTVNKLTEKLKDSMGAAIFARKMELNLNKKLSESVDVFDFDDDSPCESQQHPRSDKTRTSTPSCASTSIANQVSQIINSLSKSSPGPASSKSPATPSQEVIYEEPPASFFSLIRNVFHEHAPSDKKLTLHKLEELVKEKLKTIDPKHGWSHESVQSAMNFLSYYSQPSQSPTNGSVATNESQDSSSSLPGSDMLPLVDYKEKNQQWQWIGGCRDSDDVMKRLSDEWNSEKDRNPSSLSDPSAPVPPPLFPTLWTVKPANSDDQRIYREQEAIRYNNPSKAFTYRVHDYEAVVGPVKGSAVISIGNSSGSSSSAPSSSQLPCPAASPNKAREHSLLVNDRPPFVTLLSLVRDAAARLPNGEGTRADICELLKDSQYLLPTVSDQQVNQIVSGALDRLHYEKDPCVKYDTNRKVWIYLHRNRTEGDFERLHEMQVAAAKAKRNLTKSRKPNLSVKTSFSSPPTVGKSLQRSVQRPSPCKSSDSSSSSNTPILPSPGLPISSRIVVSPLAPKPVAIVPQPRKVEPNLVLDMLTKSSQQTYQLAPTSSNYVVKKTGSNSFAQATEQPNQVILKPIEAGVRSSNLSPVVSVISLSSLNSVNRVITTSPVMMRDNIRPTNPANFQKVGSATSVVRPFSTATCSDQMCHRLSSPSIRITEPGFRQVAQPHMSNTLPPGTQSLTIPSSMLLSGRPGQVVLGGKAYMMATTSGGSIVLHPQNPGSMQVAGNPSSSLTGVVQPLSVRTLQGIKVVPVSNQFHPPGSNQRVTPVISGHPVASQNGSIQPNQQFVARLISTRPAQIQGNQMIIPNNGGYQQVILTPTSQVAGRNPIMNKPQTVNQVQIQPVNSFQNQITVPQTTPLPPPPPSSQVISSVRNNTQ